jgi:5-bromo-4-chloroindolyl phosphate hydrolysis protein
MEATMQDITIIQQNLDEARKRLNEAQNNVDRAKALNDIIRYEHTLATSDN